MREILFRGKTYDGIWEQGDLRHGGYVHNDSETYIMRSDYALHNIPVDPETVGQCTGLTDKNGKKIFEGDIIDTPDRLIKVIWLEANAQFDLVFIKHAHNKNIINFRGIYMRDLKEYEVIGNIYDNPELLEGGTDNGHP